MSSLTIDDSFSASNDLRSNQVSQTQQPLTGERTGRQRSAERSDDQSDISALGAAVTRILATDPPQILQRVEQLQEAVATNNFSVPAQDVADSVVNDALRSDSIEALLAAASGRPAPPSP